MMMLILTSNITLIIMLIIVLLLKEMLTYTSNKYNVEEYYVEHEISTIEAKNSARSIDLNTLAAPPGCQECTKEEKLYCLNNHLINDHCCCDKRHEEVLPHVPHTCYRGSRLCNVVLNDCAQYNRLRECCCDKFTKEFWKKKLHSSTNRIKSNYLLIIITTLFINLLFTINHIIFIL